MLRRILQEIVHSNKYLDTIERIKETFSLFYFYPLLFTGLIIIILVIFDSFSFALILPVFLGCYVIYTFLWFLMFGKRKMKLHDGNE